MFIMFVVLNDSMNDKDVCLIENSYLLSNDDIICMMMMNRLTCLDFGHVAWWVDDVLCLDEVKPLDVNVHEIGLAYVNDKSYLRMFCLQDEYWYLV